MKFTLVLVEIRAGFPGFSGHYSEGVASLAAVTRRCGHDFELVHLTKPIAAAALAHRVARTKPDLVGFSCTTHTFPYAQAFIPVLKAALPGTPIVLGGVHALLNPEACLGVRGLDAVCLGEGEAVLEAMLARLGAGQSLADLAGLWVREGEVVHRNAVLPLLEDLDALPLPERGIFDFPRLMTSREGVLYIFASRGCPYSCHFCCNAAIRERFPNRARYVRFKSVPRVCEEIETALRLFPGTARGIYFQDEILPMNKVWFASFTAMYRQRIGLPFNCNLRADLVTEELVTQLRGAGCAGVSIGLETGSQSLRKEVLGKAIADEVFHEACRLIRAAGIRITAFSMVGLPGETVEDALATVQMNADLGVHRTCISIFCPYPDTRLYAECKERNLLSAPLPDTYQEASPLVQESIQERQVRFIHDHFGLLVSLAAKPHSRLRAVLWGAIRRNAPILSAFSRGQRWAKYLLSRPYLFAGRFLFNRQKRIFVAEPGGRPQES